MKCILCFLGVYVVKQTINMKKKTTFFVPMLVFALVALFAGCKKTDNTQTFLQTQRDRNKAEIEAYIAQSGKSFIRPADSEGFYYNIEDGGATSGPKADTASFTDVTVKYRVRILPSLTVVDDDYANKILNFILDCNAPLVGINAAVKIMYKNSKGTFLFNNDGAYGASGSPFIPAYSAVVVDLELVDLKTEQQFIDEYIALKGYTSVIQTPEGIKYAKLTPPTTSTSDAIEGTSKISVDYVGRLVKKPETAFDQNIDYNLGSATLASAGVISGWKIGLIGKQVGETGILFIPSKYAYGKSGKAPIPCYAPLLFEIKIKSVTK